jgi:thioredoxin-dependent peroxiredoxin
VTALARYVAAMERGDTVEDFTLPDETGTPRTLSDLLANGPVVLFFYPAAMTMGCTKESCHFRDLASEFAAVGAQRVGISRDAVDKQKQFSDKHSFDYPLLSDEDGTVAQMMGVARTKGPPKRVTFVIDQDRKVVEVIKSEIRMSVHADKALDALRSLPR